MLWTYTLKPVFKFIGRIFPNASRIVDLRAPSVDFMLYAAKMRSDILHWRLLCIIFFSQSLVIFIFGNVSLVSLFSNMAPQYVARIKIEGAISAETVASDHYIKMVIEKVANDKNAVAVIVHISSPGGTVHGSEVVYKALRRLSAKKLTVASVGDIAASGGYVVALGCDKIFADSGSIVGSIGVITMIQKYKRILDKIGIDIKTYKSSKFKAAPNAVEDSDPEIDAAAQEFIMGGYQWFAQLVKSRRALSDQEFQKIGDAKVFQGGKALEYRLIDGIADRYEILEMFKADGVVPKNARIVDIELPKTEHSCNHIKNAISAIIGGVVQSIAKQFSSLSLGQSDTVMAIKY